MPVAVFEQFHDRDIEIKLVNQCFDPTTEIKNHHRLPTLPSLFWQTQSDLGFPVPYEREPEQRHSLPT
jgi:hypothetical protein